MSGFGFHAAPPAGQWINDPNGLIFAGGRYRLFVQHRVDAPDFAITGWGRFSSDDLLQWQWDGEVLPASNDGFAYSGSIIATPGGGDVEAWHTRHRPAATPRERQFVARSSDAGLTWSAPDGPFGPAGHNARDPFVFDHDGTRHMLVARPRDWSNPTDASQIEIASQDADGEWSSHRICGLDIDPDLLCEVPSLLRFGDRWVLLASFVDRGDGGAASWCGYWSGGFDGDRFKPDQPNPTRVDIGPDFYAAIANLEAGWPEARMVIGWASSWATARQLAVPGGGSGGPVSLPRRIEMHGQALHLAPIAAALPHATPLSWSGRATLTIKSDQAVLVIELAHGQLDARRTGPAGWDWACTHRDTRIAGELLLFHDAGLVEIFIGGIAMTVILPGTHKSIEWDRHDVV